MLCIIMYTINYIIYYIYRLIYNFTCIIQNYLLHMQNKCVIRVILQNYKNLLNSKNLLSEMLIKYLN